MKKTETTAALKKTCAPVSRRMGFKNSFPNFSRDIDGCVALVSFQFNADGEAFCGDLGFTDPERRNLVSHCKDVKLQKLRGAVAGGLPENGNALSERRCLSREDVGEGLYSDTWFAFARKQYGGDRSIQEVDPQDLARTCVELIEQEAEAWWRGRRAFTAAK